MNERLLRVAMISFAPSTKPILRLGVTLRNAMRPWVPIAEARMKTRITTLETTA